MLYFSFGALVLIAIAVAAHLFVRANPAQLAAAIKMSAGYGCLAAGGLFTLTGRAPIGVPLIAAGLMLVGYRGLLGGVGWSGRRSGGQRSRVRTSVLEMELDHDTGDMAGRVLVGGFEGRTLEDLSLTDLLALYELCLTAGDQSSALLEAYLDRAYPDWREGANGRQEERDASSKRTRKPGGKSAMTRAEAYDILGLRPGASTEEITKAHRTLMKRFHPDQGGSGYLAAQINQAKDLLLGNK